MNFFDELENVRCKVPRPALHNFDCENSEYGNFCAWNKNSYMVFATDYCQDCLYTRWLIKGINSADCTNSHNLELCYECVACKNCYNCDYMQDCENCNDCEFCFDCIGCSDCFGCAGLRHKRYYIFNKSYSKDDYEREIANFPIRNVTHVRGVLSLLEKIKETVPHLYGRFKNNENVAGDYLYNCKNCFKCFELKESEDCAYLNEGWGSKDCFDTSFVAECIECYECMVAYNQNNCNFCWYCFNSSSLEYCEYCIDCNDCFGCVGLKRKSYYILNKPYEKEAYFKEAAKIKEQMKSEGAYAKKFLSSTYPFEDTLAADL